MKAIQCVISNLSLTKIEARTDLDPDLLRFSKHREVDPIKVNSSIAVDLINTRLTSTLSTLLHSLSSTLSLDDERAVMPACVSLLSYDSVRAVYRSFMRNYDTYATIVDSIL